MIFQIIWFILWATLWSVYFMLDGYDFGTGILHSFIAKSETEKRIVINTIGPHWDGNEVWLITAGGATFAAFPTTYALMFSYLYAPLLVILFALIFRGVALEFRGKLESHGWLWWWDAAIFLGSLVPAFLFGVAFGNIFKGLPMDAGGYHGSLLSLLNPYGLLSGMFFVLIFMEHGALWLALKTDGNVRDRSARFARANWNVLFLAMILFFIYTGYGTELYANYRRTLILFAVPFLALVSLIGIRVYSARAYFGKAFLLSSLTIILIMATGMIGLYPNLIPSSIDAGSSLTIFNSSSSVYTLKIMTVVAVIFVPVVIAYQIWIHKIFSGKITSDEY